MPILILGVALWWAAHLFKRIAPKARASMGQSGKGAVTAALILSVVLMIWGYRAAPIGDVWWGPSPMMKGIMRAQPQRAMSTIVYSPPTM